MAHTEVQARQSRTPDGPVPEALRGALQQPVVLVFLTGPRSAICRSVPETHPDMTTKDVDLHGSSEDPVTSG
jgi:hypothetical protein